MANMLRLALFRLVPLRIYFYTNKRKRYLCENMANNSPNDIAIKSLSCKINQVLLTCHKFCYSLSI